jgi:hypothetical protein
MPKLNFTEVLMLTAFGSALLLAVYLTLPPELSGSRHVASVLYTAWPFGRL